MNFYICRQKADFSTFNLPSAALTNFHSKKQFFVYYAQMRLLLLWRWFLLTDDSEVSLTPCRFSVSLAPSVTLTRDTFLPGSNSDKLLRKKNAPGKKQEKRTEKTEEQKKQERKNENRRNEKSPPPSI